MRLVKLATILAIPLLAAACAQQGGLGNGMGGGMSSGMGGARFARYMHQHQTTQPAPNATQENVSATGYCREFEETILVDGKPQHAYGKACRQPDNSWKIVS